MKERDMETLEQLSKIIARSPTARKFVKIPRDLAWEICAELQRKADVPTDLDYAGEVLRNTEFKIYRALYLANGAIVPQSELMTAAGIERKGTLWVRLHGLRAQAEQHGLGRIDTIMKEGYALVK